MCIAAGRWCSPAVVMQCCVSPQVAVSSVTAVGSAAMLSLTVATEDDFSDMLIDHQS